MLHELHERLDDAKGEANSLAEQVSSSGNAVFVNLLASCWHNQQIAISHHEREFFLRHSLDVVSAFEHKVACASKRYGDNGRAFHDVVFVVAMWTHEVSSVTVSIQQAVVEFPLIVEQIFHLVSHAVEQWHMIVHRRRRTPARVSRVVHTLRRVLRACKQLLCRDGAHFSVIRSRLTANVRRRHIPSEPLTALKQKSTAIALSVALKKPSADGDVAKSRAHRH